MRHDKQVRHAGGEAGTQSVPSGGWLPQPCASCHSAQEEGRLTRGGAIVRVEAAPLLVAALRLEATHSSRSVRQPCATGIASTKRRPEPPTARSARGETHSLRAARWGDGFHSYELHARAEGSLTRGGNSLHPPPGHASWLSPDTNAHKRSFRRLYIRTSAVPIGGGT